MTNAVPHTFIDIFKGCVDKVVIPIIQRDYAQGRENDAASRIRSRFLEALRVALVDDSPITLDFIYGEVDSDGALVPLDGQQRLTTLFLLHWYVSKHEGVESTKCKFLENFSYKTRASAREFCSRLCHYEPDFERDDLSSEILDQAWFPMDWAGDPTVASMLVMIDAIHLKFKDTAGIWQKLEDGAISFYFLSLKEMGLTDELYIKMNSRGKPLTLFEHFKAELEGAMKQVDPAIAERIGRKIDLAWTDMLWPYKGDNQIIDDEFVRYFHFICDIIRYKAEDYLIEDPFRMVQMLFSTDNPSARDNMLYVESLFDCWCGFDIDAFFGQYLTTTGHVPGKSVVGKMSNLFLDCCNCYGEMQGAHVRRFPLGRTVLLYAFVIFLQNRLDISDIDFVRRLRVLGNLVRASEYELRDDRMKALLTQTEAIILEGRIELVDKSFNLNQLNEEMDKNVYLEAHPEAESLLCEAEDHRLLNGAVRILGIEGLHLYPRFKQLFDCPWDLVDKAMLTVGDYSRFINWRFQIGSAKIDSVWRDLFNTSEEDMVSTKTVLTTLLEKYDHFDDSVLESIVSDYMASDPVKDWRYYLIKYDSMRPGRYGMYRWPDEGRYGKVSRVILMMTTEKSTNGWNYNIFLKTLYDSLKDEIPSLYLGNYAFQHDGDKLFIGSSRAISSDDSSFTVYDVLDNKSYEVVETVGIPQDESGLNDAADRVELGIGLIRSLAQD